MATRRDKYLFSSMENRGVINLTSKVGQLHFCYNGIVLFGNTSSFVDTNEDGTKVACGDSNVTTNRFVFNDVESNSQHIDLASCCGNQFHIGSTEGTVGTTID